MVVRRFIATVALAAAAAGSVMVATVPAAAADTSTGQVAMPQHIVPAPAGKIAVKPAVDTNCYAVYTPDGGAMACFEPYGEHLFVCDTSSDGHHPGVDYWINDGEGHFADYDLGAGYCHDINLSIAESGHIDFYAVNVEGSTWLSWSDILEVSADG
jgi:hypothetical protein